MAVNAVDWDALKLFLSDHPDAFSSLERDKHGTRYLVLTANVKPVKTVEAPAKETEATSDKEAVAATDKEEEEALVEEEDEEEEKEVEDDSGVEEDDEEVEVFKIEIKDTLHEEAVDNLRNIAVASFVGAFTSTMLSYCAC